MANNKWGKKLLGLVAVGAAVGGVIAYLNKKNNCCNSEDSSDDFENEDFDLDEDLKEAASREYVSLTPDTSSDTESDEEVQPEEENVSAEEVSAEETEQSDNE